MGVFDLLLGKRKNKEIEREVYHHRSIHIDMGDYEIIQLYEKYNLLSQKFHDKYNKVIGALNFFNEEILNNSKRMNELINYAKKISELKERISIKYGFGLNYYGFFNELEILINKLINDKNGNIFNIHSRNEHLFEKGKKTLDSSDDKYIEEIHKVIYQIIDVAKYIDFQEFNNEKYPKYAIEFVEKVKKTNIDIDNINRKIEYQINGMKNHINSHSNKNKKLLQDIEEIQNLKNKYKHEIIDDKEVSDIYFKIVDVIERGFATKEFAKIWEKIYSEFNKDKLIIEDKLFIEKKSIFNFSRILNKLSNLKKGIEEPNYGTNFI